jgi:hypothetical protein
MNLFLAAAAQMVCLAVLTDNVYAKPRSGATSMTMFDSITACEEERYSSENPVNCVVTYVQGHPTLAVEFANESSMNANLGEFSERVAVPFCEAATNDEQSAFFVVALKNPRMGSVSSCETNESSGWVSLDSLRESN